MAIPGTVCLQRLGSAPLVIITFLPLAMEPPKKRPRRINVTLPSHKSFVWESPYNMEGKITVSLTNEVGDGASSTVYVGTLNCREFAVKKLKGYSYSQLVHL